jgi:hypothetical protein
MSSTYKYEIHLQLYIDKDAWPIDLALDGAISRQ